MGQNAFAQLMDAQIRSRKEECAEGMVQRSNNAVLKVAQTKPLTEECA